MNVLFRYDAGPRLLEKLREQTRPEILVTVCSEADEGAYRNRLRPANVLWHVLAPVTADDIAAAPNLRLIQKIGVGVNTIDLESARARGIAVCNMPGTNSRAVAEMTLLLMLAALRRLPALDRAVRRADWLVGAKLQEDYGELAGRIVGLVGYGAVPRLLAPILAAMGANVTYAAHEPKSGAAAEWRTLDQLLVEADIVSLHVPLTPETERMIDRRALARMKPGAILVNTARGGLVDEAALIEALESHRLVAAALDVFAAEPIAAAHPLARLDNVVLAPHVAWLTPETWARSLGVALENVRRLGAGEPLLHRVI